MLKMRTPIIALSLCIFFFSCEKKKELAEEIQQPSYNQLEYNFNLPDTVIVNKPYSATIEFKSDFDTIIDPVQINPHDPTTMRLITFYHYEPVQTSIKPGDNLILIDSTFVLNKSFEVDNIMFKETGEFIFCGLILDEIRYQGFTKDGILTSIRFEEQKQEIRKKVVVVDK